MTDYGRLSRFCGRLSGWCSATTADAVTELKNYVAGSAARH
jgi:hypothetical protein